MLAIVASIGLRRVRWLTWLKTKYKFRSLLLMICRHSFLLWFYCSGLVRVVSTKVKKQLTFTPQWFCLFRFGNHIRCLVLISGFSNRSFAGHWSQYLVLLIASIGLSSLRTGHTSRGFLVGVSRLWSRRQWTLFGRSRLVRIALPKDIKTTYVHDGVAEMASSWTSQTMFGPHLVGWDLVQVGCSCQASGSLLSQI